ncbi:MAG TPA: c-type cytochrome biogenesis protein CcmI [Hyphomicrobium sp.]|uniref:c-type cytochrome biogenesis protein CcmI n=1 Tax=Hyphomicrobium sp. TaxID=82 RepID=UPI002B95408B|nr:c-type cytochrome biogenesis protein CcmI [Hyphomicrobium sp.]HXE00837.1 c-type cytochrome biogenesis protein CcmI [Hyphomicrobium sp.]
MLFWILVGVLVAGVTLAITRPLTRSAGPPVKAADADIAVYKDQLREVVADAARGSLAAREAEAASAEIARRLLRSTETNAKSPDGGPGGRGRFAKPIYVVTSIALPVASLALYLAYGAPGLPGQPLSERIATASDTMKPNDLVAKVEARLRDHPDDGTGWDVIAPVYYAMGRYADAAEAYGNALRLVGESPRRLQGFANARIRAEDGVIPQDAKKALERILVMAPDSKEPRIWLALAKEQDGHLTDAAADYRKLIAEAPADAPWRKVLEERLAGLTPGAGKGAADSNGKQADGATPSSTPDAAAVSAMSPEERQAFIGRMVDGLAARLKADGTDAAGWLKLIRAYDVLGRRDDAIKALNDARTGLKNDKGGLASVEDLARQLGLGS